MRKGMSHIAVTATQASSVTLKIWQHGAKEKYSKFETNTKTSIIKMGPNILNVG